MWETADKWSLRAPLRVNCSDSPSWVRCLPCLVGWCRSIGALHLSRCSREAWHCHSTETLKRQTEQDFNFLHMWFRKMDVQDSSLLFSFSLVFAFPQSIPATHACTACSAVTSDITWGMCTLQISAPVHTMDQNGKHASPPGLCALSAYPDIVTLNLFFARFFFITCFLYCALGSSELNSS